MIQTDTDTPMTDIFYSAEYAANRKGWTDAQLEHARRLERDLAKAKDEAENQRQAAILNAEQRDNARQDLAKANADRAVLVEALDDVVRAAPALTAEIAEAIAALSQVQA